MESGLEEKKSPQRVSLKGRGRGRSLKEDEVRGEAVFPEGPGGQLRDTP